MIAGDRVTLVAFEERFVTDAYLSWLNDPDLMRYSGQRLRRHDRASSLAYLAGFRGSANHFWALRRRSDDLFFGTMTAYVDSHDRVADIGILIGHPDARGRGLGREAWGLAMRFLFAEQGMRKVTGGTSALNLPMLSIFAYWHMTLEGTRREQQLIGGRPTDVLLFGILRADWEALTPRAVNERTLDAGA